MNTIIILGIIIAVAVSIIAVVVVYQFVQQQTALNKLENLVNPRPEPNPESPLGYNTYEECLNYWKEDKYGVLANQSDTEYRSTPESMCEEYK